MIAAVNKAGLGAPSDPCDKTVTTPKFGESRLAAVANVD